MQLSCSRQTLDQTSAESLSGSMKRLESLRKAPSQKMSTLITGPTKSNENSPFVDMTKSWGLEGKKAISLYAVDFTGDKYTDLITIPDHYGMPEFFKFSVKENKFKLIKSPLPSDVRASFLVFFDRNNDGLQDMIVATLNQKTELTLRPLRMFMAEKTKGGVVFRERLQVFPEDPTPTASVGLLDFDLDGDLDLFQGNWFKTTKENRKTPSADRLLINEKGLYKNVGNLLEGEYKKNREGREVNAKPTFGVSICDMDQDGYPDIITSSSSGQSNNFWLNMEDTSNKFRTFKNFSKEFGLSSDLQGAWSSTGGGNTFFALCGDYNNDGIMDLVQGEMWHPYQGDERDRSAILTGSSVKYPLSYIRTEFFGAADETASRSHSHKRGVWVDIDNDGHVDVLVDDTGFPPDSRLMLLRQFKDHAFEGQGQSLGIDVLNPSGTITIDVDRDGRKDIITGQTSIRNNRIERKIFAFHNKIPRNGNRSLTFYLTGTSSNRDALGATVLLKGKNHKQRKWVSYTFGSLPSQSESGVHFGLGRVKPLEVQIRWPFKKSKIKVVKYDLSSLRFKNHLDLTLCENGKLIVGRWGVCERKEGL